MFGKNEILQRWIARHFTSTFLLTGLVIMFIGIATSYLFYSAPRYSFRPTFSGFGVARNSTNISPEMLVVGIGLDPPELWFQYFFSCSANGTYNFLFVFPFYVTSTYASKENMSLRATSQGSAIWLQYQVSDVSYGWESGEVWGVFSIENTFQSGFRGSYMFLLPFGMGIHPEVYGNLQRELGVTFHTPDTNITLQFGLPARYQITQTFPPLSSGPETWVTYTNRTITTVKWEFETLQNSVTIYCQDPNEIAFYDHLLFISGLGYGIGVSIVITTVYEAVKDWALQLRNIRPDQRRPARRSIRNHS